MLKAADWHWLVVFPALAIAACTTKPVSRTTVDRVAAAPSVPNAPYGNIVVVGIAPSRDLAREMEEGLLQQFEDRGVEVHSFVKESSATEMSQEAVQALVEARGADAVLTISGRLAGADLDEHAEPVDMETRAIGGNLINFFRYDYEEFAEPTYTDITLDVSLVANLFDAASNDRVHTVETSTRHGETSYQIIVAQSKAIVSRLKKDGMID